MDQTISIGVHFSDLKDPRVERNRKHHLLDIIGIVICATACGAEGWDEMVDCAICKESWLRKWLKLDNGIPCADTIRRVMERLNPKSFNEKFRSWINHLAQSSGNRIVSIDGKRMNGSSSPINLVSAWTNANGGLCLGQVATDLKSNEISAIPELLELLDIEGALITIDAIGCQTNIAKKIVQECEADYVLAVKANQPELFQTIKEFFDSHSKDLNIPCESHRTYDHDHGRDEVRRYFVSHEVDWMPCFSDWVGLSTIGYVEAEVDRGKGTTIERRYYISSKKLTAKQFSKAVREHWGIENSLHWVLDVVFREDDINISNTNANENLNIIRKMVMTSLKSLKKKGESYRRLRKRCMWDNDYLLKVLLG
jgi:predicted transposase YbfD/YdcC